MCPLTSLEELTDHTQTHFLPNHINYAFCLLFLFSFPILIAYPWKTNIFFFFQFDFEAITVSELGTSSYSVVFLYEFPPYLDLVFVLFFYKIAVSMTMVHYSITFLPRTFQKNEYNLFKKQNIIIFYFMIYHLSFTY